VQRHFLPRLARQGMDRVSCDMLLTINPRRVFDAAI
jgi:predicted metal-dependent phosphotriesterase family hydrolase